MSVGISVHDLSKKFEDVLALKHISINFTEGRLHGLIGSDGAGKTTLIRLLLNLLYPNAGQVSYTSDGKKVTLKDIRDTMSYMPSRPCLYPDLTINEHLLFFKEIYMISETEFKERSAKLLDVTRLEKFGERKAGELSGGMYKKLGLMCAMLQNPQALILDEPTNGVDPISRREFWDMLYGLAEQKILIIIATAYMDEAERCHEVHLMDDGNVIASGEPRKLLKESNARSFDEVFIKLKGE